MPLTTEIKTPQGASMVQRGIDSFFKSPSRPTEEKKGLLNYFQKQSPEVEKQNSLTGTNTDKLSAVNESSKNNSPDKKNDNVKCNIFESSSKFNGKTSEVKPLKSKLKRSKKGDLDSQNDKPSVDIENKNHKSLNEEKAKSKLKLTKKSDSKKKNNHHDISQEDETSQLILKDVTNESKSKVKNKDNDSIVVKEVDLIEVSVEETNLRNASPVKTPGNKSSSKIKEMEKKDSDSLLKANPKTGNAFAFMMANRHKQDEVIKEIEEKEEENSKAEVTSSAESEELALKSNRNHLLNDDEDEQIFIKKSPKEEKIKKESKPSTNNAFSFLMSNRFNSPVEKRTKKVDESDNSNSDNLKIDEEEIKQSKKRKQTAANSISCDSDADDVLETKKKKKTVKKQNEVEKNKDQKKISVNHNTPVNNNILVTKNEGSNIDVTEVITKVNEEDDTSQNNKFCKKSDSLQTISFASFMNETTEGDKDKMEKVNIKDDLLKKTQKESDSCQTISFASFMKESSEGDKEKLERVNGKDDSLKKNVRFDNSDNEEDKCYSLKSDKRSKKFDPDPDDDDDEWDIDSENETKRHETKKKKMKMSFGMFRKKSKSDNNIDIKKNDDVKMSDSQNEDLTSHISPLSEITPEKKNEKVSINEKKADEIENNTEEIMDREPKKKGISNFFKKMTKDEQLEARNKNIVTIKVDVHATNDGKEEECVGKNVRRSTRRQPKQKEEPVELDKIELLEQVDVSPMKYYRKEKIRTLNDTLEYNSTSKTTIKETDGNDLVRDKQVKVTDKQKTSHLEKESSEEVSVDNILSKSQNKDEKENDINKEDVKEIPLRPKRTSAKFSLNFDIEDDISTNGKSEERPLRSRRSVSTTPEVDVGDRKSKRLKTKLQSPAASSADQDNDPENEDPVVAATSGRRIASSVSSSGSVNSPVKYTATLDSTPGKLSLKLKKVSKLSKKLNKESPDLGSQKKLLLSRGKKKIMTPAEMKALLQEVQGDAEDEQDTDDTSADKSLKKSKKKLILKRSSKSPLKNKKTRQMLLASPGLSPKVKALAKGKKKSLNGSARHQEAVAAKEKRNKNTEGGEETDSDIKESNARRSSRQAVVNAKNIVEVSSEDESRSEEQQEKKRTKRCSKEKDQSEVKNKVNCLTQTPIKKEVILVATPRGKNLRKTTWCGKCAGCKTANCQKCTHCKNMPKYGGPGTLKKPCKKRKCFNPNVSVKAAMSGNKEIKSSKGLASIFMKKKDVDIEVLEVVLSPSKLKARQDFLQSGVPETIKKKVLIEKRLEEEFNDAAVFPSVSHVQQVETDHWVWNLTHQKVKNLICESTVLEDLAAQSKSLFMSPLSEAEVTEDILPQQPELMDSKTLCSILCGIKKRNANFPVFAVFKSYLDQKKEGVESYKKELEKEMKSKTVDIVDLMSPDKDDEIGNGKRKRRSKGSPVNKKQKLSRSKGKRNSIDFASENTDTVPIWQKWTPNAWTQMFAPNHSSQVIGNVDILRKMKVWLLEWKKQTESDAFKQKSSKKKARREDDFLTSDESCGWEDDNELANTLLLAGPPGVGKTAAVYALAQELGYKVLEVNASSQRKGAQVMKQLAEATQSHSMSGGNSSQGTPGGTPSKNPLTAMFGSKQKKKTKEKVIVQEDSSSVDKEKKMAMVLFEDIDIVFDEYDDGFIMAVNNIMAETKRPIILTTTYLTPNVLAKIKGNFEYLTFQTPANELVCQHLELMALSGGVAACREDLCWLIEHCRGDIRQAISTLQSWILTGSSHTMCVNGLEFKQMSNGNNTEEWICNVKEITLKEVFPDTKETLLREVHVHRGSLFGYLSRNTSCNSNAMTSVYKLPWTKIFINLPHLLPFHLVENVVEKKTYPLNPESAEVKKSVLYQKQNWLSFDDESDDDEKLKSEGQEQVSNNTDKIKGIKTDAPPDVIKSSKLCLQSISTLSSTLCDLDIFNSVPEMGNLMSHESGFEWRSWQPTPGLSDGYCTHQDWASQNFVTDLNNYVSCSAADHCSMQVKDALVITSTPDHPQLCVSLEKTNIKSQTLISRAPQIDRTIKQLEQISSILPTTVQQNKAILGCDYFPALRQIVRFDELGAALSHKRRGRRFLSYMSGLGFHLDPSEKINMANTLLD